MIHGAITHVVGGFPAVLTVNSDLSAFAAKIYAGNAIRRLFMPRHGRIMAC